MTIDNIKNPILIDIPMPIVTPRLILHPPLPGDGATLHAAKRETWADIHRWMPWAKELGTVDDDEIVCREAYANYILRQDIMLFGFSRDDGRFVLSTGLHRFNWMNRRFEIGYWVRKSDHRKGFASEAANALTRYAFGALDANAVAIEHADGNDASKGVIQKLGFDFEGTERNSKALPDGNTADHHIYSRINTKGLLKLDVEWDHL